MVFKVVSTGAHNKLVNNIPVVRKSYNVDIDSTKQPLNQVNIEVEDNKDKYKTRDSLQIFMNKCARYRYGNYWTMFFCNWYN